MRTIAALSCLTLLLSACIPQGSPTPASPAADTSPPVRYACDDEVMISAIFRPDALDLTLPEGTVTLGAIPSASGARYGNGSVEFWDKGGEALLITADGQSRQCLQSLRISPWDSARQRGIEFRAVGQEPGWLLEIDQQADMLLELDYGTERVILPAVEAIRDPARNLVTWHTETAGRRLTVISRTEPCADTMSGEMFDERVTVIINDRTLTGCGRALPGYAVGER